MESVTDRPKSTRRVTRSFGRDITNGQSPPQLPAPETLYTDPIYSSLVSTQARYTPNLNYLEQQPELSASMRAILFDWLVEVHLKFHLMPQTLYLALSVIDRYLSLVEVPKSRLQLIGVSAMLVACKFEEVYPPKTKDFVYITDSAYSKQQVLQTEVDILRVLEYNIASPTPYQFLEILSSSLRLTPQEFHFAQFLLELSVLEYSLLQHTPSVQAGSAAFVACKLLRTCSPQMPYFERGELRKCAKDLVVLVQTQKKWSLKAVQKKFALE